MEEPAGATAWNKARIEALSDGIFAIVMTLLVLDFARIHRVDKPLLWINLPFLMFVSLLPFSIAMRGRLVADSPSTRSVTYLPAALLLGPIAAVITIAVEPDVSFTAFAVGQALALGIARRKVRKAPI